MTQAYFAPLAALPTIIDEPGPYLTRSGERVTIFIASKAHAFDCWGRYENGYRENWHPSGRLFATGQSVNDIVSKVSECAAPISY